MLTLPPGITSEEAGPQHRAVFAIDLDWDVPSNGRWLEYLNELWPDDPDAIAVLQELIGVALIGRPTDYAVCVLLLGGGCNGKSGLLDALGSIFFPGVTSHINPSQWSHEYYLAQLRYKRLNVVQELPTEALESSSVFKSVIAGDIVKARNPYGRPTDFRPVALHIFSANELPRTQDTTAGFWRRFRILEMRQKFSGQKSQREILDELMTDKIGAVMWALEGASRARINKGIHQYTRSQQAQAEWMAEADSVLGFIEHACEPSENPPQATGREIYEAYLQWCALSGRKPLKFNTVCKRLSAQGIEAWRTSTQRGYRIAIRPATLRNPG